jgi:hypothetical protein
MFREQGPERATFLLSPRPRSGLKSARFLLPPARLSKTPTDDPRDFESRARRSRWNALTKNQ